MACFTLLNDLHAAGLLKCFRSSKQFVLQRDMSYKKNKLGGMLFSLNILTVLEIRLL